MIVIDASALIEVLLGTAASEAVQERITATPQSLHAPHLLDLEVTQVLRRWEARAEIDRARTAQAVQDLIEFPIVRHQHARLLPRVWELRSNLTAYDAVCVALGESLGATLVTRDARLAAAPGVRSAIEVV